MATAEVSAEADDVDAMISRTLRAIIAFQGGARPRARVIAALGCSRSSFYNRLAGETHWSAAEVKKVADALGVSVATLFNGLPHLDSNQKPAELQQTDNVVSLAEYRTRRNIERRPYDATGRRSAPDSDLATVHFLTVSAAS